MVLLSHLDWHKACTHEHVPIRKLLMFTISSIFICILFLYICAAFSR